MTELTRKDFWNMKQGIRKHLYSIRNNSHDADLIQFDEKEIMSDVYIAKVNWWCQGDTNAADTRAFAEILMQCADECDLLNADGGIRVID